MARFFLKHLLFLCLTLLVVSLIVFVLTEFTPGDVARKMLGAYATQEQVSILTKQMGLDRPVLVRYFEYIGHLAQGDLGYSTRFKVPVKDIIFDRLANTGLLGLIAFAIIVPLSMLLGITAAGFIPVVLGEVARRSPPAQIGALTAGANVFLIASMLVAPLIFGAIASTLSYGAAFVVLAVFALMGSSIATTHR